MKKLLFSLLALVLSCCAVNAQVGNSMGVPNMGASPSYKTLFCQNVGGNTVCTGSDGNNWGCTTAQPSVCTVPSTLVNGEAWIEACSGGGGGGGGQSGAGNAGGGGGGGGACIASPSWRVQITPSAQLNIQVGAGGTGGAIGAAASGGANTTTNLSGAALLTLFPSLTLGGQAQPGAAGTGGTGGPGAGIGSAAGAASGASGTGTTAVRGPSYIFGAPGGGGGPSAGTGGAGGSSIVIGSAAAGTGNGAGGGGGSCFKGIGNAGGIAGSTTPTPTGFCGGGGGGGSNQAGANGSPGYLILGAIW